MKQYDSNPTTNELGAGVTEEDLADAINRSGYPLQSVVVDRILTSLAGKDTECTVQEEWSFVDSDSQEVRQLDALISCRLNVSKAHTAPQRPREAKDYLRTSLDLLIECKQSELPFVFFVRPSPTGDVPNLVGLPAADMSLKTNMKGDFSVGMSVFDVLGLWDLEFSKYDTTAISMTRVYRKGKLLELSGEDAFRGIALPLLKAFDYHVAQSAPGARRLYHDLRVVVPLVVLRAPIVVVRMEQEQAKMEAAPWVRVVRTEPGGSNFLRLSEMKTFDAVHVDYLSQYLELVLGAARAVSERSAEFAIQLLTGQAHWTDETSEGEDDGIEQPEPLPYKTMLPTLNPTEFDELMRQRWIEVHSGTVDASADDGMEHNS